MTTQKSSRFAKERIAGILLVSVDVLIAALIFILPFIMGGREAWGHWFLITASLLLGATWAAYATISGCRYRLSWLEIFLLAGFAIVWLQVQPQSLETMSRFSAEYERLLPTWTATQTDSELSHWSTLSFTPVETRHGWWVFLSYAVIVVVIFQRLIRAEDCYRLLKCIAIVGVSMTAFALLQWATSDGRFFWFYEHPFTDTSVHLKGSFTNRNHFAQFLSLTIGPLLWWLLKDLKAFLKNDSANPMSSTTVGQTKRKPSNKRRTSAAVKTFNRTEFQLPPGLPIVVLLASVVLVIVAVLLSESRGGMIAGGAATIIAAAGLWRGFKLGGAMAAVLLGGGIICLSALAFSDQEQLQTKLDQLISADAEQLDGGGNRRAVWAADAKVIQRFPLLGTGVGSHRDVYTLYMDNYADFAHSEMTHAESSFVHAALETGLIGVGCLIVALLCTVGRLVVGVVRTSLDANRACSIAVIASMVAGILHAVVDFIWYAPGIVVISLALVAIGLRTSSSNYDVDDHSNGGIWFPRLGWATVSGICLLGLIAIQPDLFARIQGEKHWYAAL